SPSAQPVLLDRRPIELDAEPRLRRRGDAALAHPPRVALDQVVADPVVERLGRPGELLERESHVTHRGPGDPELPHRTEPDAPPERRGLGDEAAHWQDAAEGMRLDDDPSDLRMG